MKRLTPRAGAAKWVTRISKDSLYKGIDNAAAKPARLPGKLKAAKATDVVGTLGSEGYMIIQSQSAKPKYTIKLVDYSRGFPVEVGRITNVGVPTAKPKRKR